jgi:hypothetical protein
MSYFIMPSEEDQIAQTAQMIRKVKTRSMFPITIT